NYDQDHHTFNLRQDSTDNDDDLGVNVARRVKNNRSRYNNINNSNNNRAYRRRVPNFNYYDDDVPPSPYIPNPNADFSPPCPMVPVQEIIPCMSETFEDKFRLSAQAFDDLTKLALGFWRECKDVPIEWANTDTFFKSVPVEFRHYRYEYDHTNEEDDSWKPPTWGDWSSIEQANKSKPANVKKKSIKRQI
ncbi:16297_t:CDS:2, partial [Entrophospora sp. SA101]